MDQITPPTSKEYIPEEVPIPPLPTNQVLSDLQWTTLLSLADTVIPSIRPAERSTIVGSKKPVPLATLNHAVSSVAARIKDDGPEWMSSTAATVLASRYIEEDVSSNQAFRDGLQRIFAVNVHEEGRRGISLVLSLLNTRAGSLLFTGHTTAIQNQPFEVRQKVLRSWQSSRLPPLRMVYRVVTLLSKRMWTTVSPTLCSVIGFPRVPVHGKPAEGFDYEFLQFPPGDSPEVIETDVVVVGSGCGGGVAAKHLAEAGQRVLVVEKSYHYPNKTFPMGFTEGFNNMFESAGSTMSDDGTLAVLSGSTWGGGGTVNWSASLQTQDYVRQEWANAGLPYFTSSRFQDSLDRVCERLGVSTDYIQHSNGNKVILEGARKLGYAAKPVPQNTGHSEHYCGHCTLGCYGAQKKGPAQSYLADAAEAGAVFIEGFHVDRVLFEKGSNNQVASGVIGTWTSRDAYLGSSGPNVVKRRVIIKAKNVIVAASSLQSPLLLLRSGIKNPQIGRNLYLHPVIMCGAVFDEATRPWEGSALTSVVNTFENLDKQGHGAKIEAASMLPAVFLPLFPWRDGLEYKLFCSRMAHATSFIPMARDKHPGRVYPDPADGRIRIDYTPSVTDRKHLVEGIIGAAKISYVCGAREFHTSYGDMPPFIRDDDDLGGDGVNNAALQEWIAQLRQRSPLDPEKGTFASAHQMGSCRMGPSPRKSVVDENCRVWGTRGLYVMDASVFPSASGVNPMITNMAIADSASRRMVDSKQMARL